MGARERVALVLLDSNTLILMARGLVAPSMIEEAVLAPVRLATTRAVVGELERLSRGHPRPSVRRAASTALGLLERLGVEVLGGEGEGDADDSLEAEALRLRAEGARVYVATSDRALRRRLRLHGVPSIYYRESSGRLEAEWSDAL